MNIIRMLSCLTICTLATQVGYCQMPNPLPAIEDLREMYRKNNPADVQKRTIAIVGLVRVTGELSNVLPTLQDGLRDMDPGIRHQAAVGLRALGAYAWLAVDDLRTALFDKSASVRATAAEALHQMGPFAERAVPDLALVLLQDTDVQVRRRAATALGWIKAQPDAAVPALLKALNDPDPGVPKKQASVRSNAARALRRYGPQAKAAVPVLLQRVKVDRSKLRGLLISALGGIRSDADKVVPVLRAILRNRNDVAVWSSTAIALGDFGPAAKDAIPDLRAAFAAAHLAPTEHQRQRIRRVTLEALGKMGKHGQKIIPFLVAVCNDFKYASAVRNSAFMALGYLGPVAEETIPFLIERLNAGDARHIPFALKAMGKKAVPALIKNLATYQGPNRYRTFGVLGMLGPDAAEAIPTLQAELADPRWRPFAETAIGGIRLKMPRKK